MYITVSILILFSIGIVITLNLARFGKSPSGQRLERIKKSPNYKDGSFQNQSKTPVMTEGKSFFSVAREMLFAEKVRVTPLNTIPSVKTDLINLDKNNDVLVWFGHSSYFMQLDGKTMLVDPVLSGHASPFSFTVKAFKGTNRYNTEDLPEIDYLIITHNHWDHLDYETLLKLKSRIKRVICPLGVGEDFEYWGFDINLIKEMDWNESVTLDNGFVANALPARHFSGRGFKRNKTLWVSYLLQTPSMKIFIGEYNENWKYIHLLPADLIKAFNNLNARRLFPVHSSKFALANHPWSEPLEKIAASSKQLHIQLITPMIGEQVNLKDSTQKFTEWWENVN